jgi:hypothetical protein
MPRAIVAVVLLLALLGLGWIFFGPKGKKGLDPTQGARFTLGREDAPIVVVDFSNYLCPHCQDHALNVLPRLKAEYIDTGKVRYLFRDFPFPGQDHVIRAGEAAACAARSRAATTSTTRPSSGRPKPGATSGARPWTATWWIWRASWAWTRGASRAAWPRAGCAKGSWPTNRLAHGPGPHRHPHLLHRRGEAHGLHALRGVEGPPGQGLGQVIPPHAGLQASMGAPAKGSWGSYQAWWAEGNRKQDKRTGVGAGKAHPRPYGPFSATLGAWKPSGWPPPSPSASWPTAWASPLWWGIWGRASACTPWASGRPSSWPTPPRWGFSSSSSAWA